VYSATSCQENEHAHGMLQSLGLDNLTMQVIVFSILILWLAKITIYPKDSGIERASPLKKVDTEPSGAAVTERTPGEFNCFDVLLLILYGLDYVITSLTYFVPVASEHTPACHHQQAMKI